MAISPKPSKLKPNQWSPNQVAKRDQIVQAASHLMGREGVAACTARSISAASQVSTSALHYYFRDTDEIVDLAFRLVIERFFYHIETVARSEPEPVDALWAAAAAYLERGSEAKPDTGAQRAPMLWFEFQAESLRKANLYTVRELSARGAAFFTDLVGRVVREDANAKAESLYCALLGAAIRNSLIMRDPEEYAAEIMDSLSLPRPRIQKKRQFQSPSTEAAEQVRSA